MSLTAEEKELKKITAEYQKAIQFFNKKDFQKVSQLLDNLIENYQDSEYYSVLEIQTRAKKYKNIAEIKLHPKRIKLNTKEDFLEDGLLNLNDGNLERALEALSRSEKEKKINDPYLYYLFSIVYLKMGEIEKSIEYLKKCINKDPHYKILAYNEPDFESLMEDEDFISVIEC